MRDYGKVYTPFWTSEDTRSLSDDGKILALYLLTSPHTNIIGCFRLPDAYVSEDLGWEQERVSEGFAELFRNGFATRNEKTRWLVVHKFLRWNQIENPNQAKAARKAAEAVPSSSGVTDLLADALREFCRFSEGWIERPQGNPSERVPVTVSKPETEQEQKQEQEQEQRLGASDDVAPGAQSDDQPGDAPRARATKRPPKDFALTDDMRRWAASECPGVDVASETAKFLDHTFATARSDWPATWRNWIRKAHENLRGKPQTRSRHDLSGMNYQQGVSADGRF